MAPTDMPRPGTPEWWLVTLDKQLQERQATIQRYEDYYAGRHNLAFATSKFRTAFGDLFDTFSDNWVQLVVDASVERLSVQGFRFGPKGSEADDAAWAIWQANGLDADSKLAHREAVKCGESYLLVAPGDAGPRITVEHPSQVIVAYDPADRRKRLAALKKWRAENGKLYATVYLSDAIHRFESIAETLTLAGIVNSFAARWRVRQAPVKNALGVVPVVPLRNNPSMMGGGRSDLEQVIPLQDAANKLVSDMIVASEYAAFRQRWATGLEVPTDPETGQPAAATEFKAAISRMWTSADPEVKFGEFSASDLNNYVQAIEMIVQHLAAQTRTPPHYLLAKMVNISGDALDVAESGLVAKCHDKHVDFGESHEEAMRLAFFLKGDIEKSRVTDAETLWKNAERRTESQVMDAAVKMKDLAVPFDAIWEYMGFSPQQVARFKADLPKRFGDSQEPPPDVPPPAGE